MTSLSLNKALILEERANQFQSRIQCVKCGYTLLRNVKNWDFKHERCPNCLLGFACIANTTGECIECQMKALDSHEVYSISDERFGDYVYDINVAIKLIHRYNLPLIEVPDLQLDYFLAVNRIERQHIDHVSDNKPGIVALLQFGGGFWSFDLLDGSHRAAKARRNGKPFLAHLMPWELAEQTIILSNSLKTGQN